MGEFREYLKAYWAAGLASYSQGKAIGNVIVGAGTALGLFGLSWASLIPPWAAPAWVTAYVLISVLVFWPYRMWKEQRAKIASLTLAGDAFPDMSIRELFDLVGKLVPLDIKALGREVMDKLSTGQLAGWGRRNFLEAPLVEIKKQYWAEADWTYYFVFDDESAQKEHVRNAALVIAQEDYFDVRFNRVQVGRTWPSKN
jgi:hypothetical protein